jgi:hypothetical protein
MSGAAWAFALANLLAALAAPQPPAPGDPAWHSVKVVDGVALSRAASPLAPWGMGEGDIAAPLAKVVAHLIDFPSLPRFMPRVKELRVLQRGDAEALVYFRFDLPWPIADRDWTVRYRWSQDGERFFMTWEDANDRGPPPSRAVRLSPMRGYWELEQRGNTTHARYVFLALLGGWLPASVVTETAWKQPLETFRGVRKATR